MNANWQLITWPFKATIYTSLKFSIFVYFVPDKYYCQAMKAFYQLGRRYHDCWYTCQVVWKYASNLKTSQDFYLISYSIFSAEALLDSITIKAKPYTLNTRTNKENISLQFKTQTFNTCFKNNGEINRYQVDKILKAIIDHKYQSL